MRLHLEVLHVPDCPNLAPMLERLLQVTDLEVTTREISTDTEASATGMAGSPTILINGIDPLGTADERASGLSCRLYRDELGRIVPAPSVDQLRAAIAHAIAHATTYATVAAPPPGEILNAWRTRALPLDPAGKAVHQAILRNFASTGEPPTAKDLEPYTADSDRSTGEVLAALHDVDAIRLAPDGRITVAYPFSAAPTRHRVRIGDHVDVYAMCAIDALGIAAMLDQDTRIESIDITTGQPVTVVMTTNGADWHPSETVVFVGADADGGPSSECCCDYLNFFTSTSAAQAWTATHPSVPGQILTQQEAQDLGTRLFQPLLTN